jgi:hypothetical protein
MAFGLVTWALVGLLKGWLYDEKLRLMSTLPKDG